MKQDFKWTENQTKQLIDLHLKYKKKVGTLQIKTSKHMWQIIADDLRREMNINVTINNCMNRWRVLERSYKKFIDNQNSTGRGRKYFLYKEQMEKFFGKKKSVHPELLLGSDTHHIPNEVRRTEETEISNKENTSEQHKDISTTEKKTPTENAAKELQKRRRILAKKASLLESIRQDRKEYYESKVAIETQKLEEIRKRNKLIEERNNILKEQNCSCKCSLDM